MPHRAEANDLTDAWRLAADMGFLEAKCRELGVHDAEVDVARMAERCRVDGDEVLCRRFDDLARALVRESHWLRDAPEAVAALVWNRLRRSGWSTKELDELSIPAQVAFLRLRHGATRQSSALLRNLAGHAGWVNACAVTPAGRRAISESKSRTLKLWDLDTGGLLATFQGHTGAVNACMVTPDGRRVISASKDRTLKLTAASGPVWDASRQALRSNAL